MHTPLNDRFVDANTTSWMADNDRENTASHQDQHKCQCCSELVHGEDFSQEYKICRECYSDMAEDHYVPPFDGFNEYIREDR